MVGLDVCIMLNEIADMLELLGENQHKIRAYRKAAYSLERLGNDLVNVWREGRLKSIPGVGDAIAAKIDEMMSTGTIKLHQEMADRIPPGVLEILSIPGLGPHTVGVIYQSTGIDNVNDLVKAAEAKQLRQLPGLGAKTEYNIIKGVELLAGISGKATLGVARPFALELVDFLNSDPLISNIEIVGSIRRGKPLVSDIDILVATNHPESVRKKVREFRRVKQITRDEPSNISGTLVLNLFFEIILVPPADFYRALVWCTGSKAHREQLLRLGLPIDEPGQEYPDEKSVYEQAGLVYIPPELRENQGEVEAAKRNQLPDLIKLTDLKGDLHVHTDWSDGADSLISILDQADDYQYEYLAITDHSQSLAISHGLSPERLHLQHLEIDKLASLHDFRVLKGSEVDILKSGTLDFDAETLRELDLVVASIHSNFKLERDAQTARLEAAIKDPTVDIIGHMTGRLLNRRPAYEIDTDYLIKLAAQTDTALEVNSHPDRLDIGEELLTAAQELGVKIAINSDAHQLPDLGLVSYGVTSARRAGLEAKQIINTWPLDKLDSWLHRKTNI